MKTTDVTKHVQATSIDDIWVFSVNSSQMRDANDCLEIREEFAGIARKYQPTKVVLDLHMVEYMSSVGVRALVTMLRAVCENQGRIFVCGLNGQLRGLLYVCSLISDNPDQPGPFEVADSREYAVQKLRSSPS